MKHLVLLIYKMIYGNLKVYDAAASSGSFLETGGILQKEAHNYFKGTAQLLFPSD